MLFPNSSTPCRFMKSARLNDVFFVLLLALALSPADALKFLGYNPLFGTSHANFLGKVADVLIEAGHEVVLLSPIVNTDVKKQSSRLARIIHVPHNNVSVGYTTYRKTVMGADHWTSNSYDPFAATKSLNAISFYLSSQCETTLTTPGLLEQLREERFDAAFSETFDLCGFAIFHLIGVRKYAVTYTFSGLDGFYAATGAPSYPSYVPASLSAVPARDDGMLSFTERIRNLLTAYAFETVQHQIAEDGRQAIERAGLADRVPPLMDLVANSTYFFINNEPLVDFPCPSVSKIVWMAGLAVQPRPSLNLSSELDDLLSQRSANVLISFGSLMQSMNMPPSFKESIRSLALEMPHVTFLWKYERPEDNIAANRSNLYTSTWLPQEALLASGRISLFVSHCGMQSTMETLYAGVPFLAVPIAFDQMRNAAMVRRAGVARIFPKRQLAKRELLIEAVRDMLEDERFSTRSAELATMLRTQPQPVRERLVRHFEFMARFGPLERLAQSGRFLSPFELYNLDIAAAAIAAVLLVVATIVFTTRKVASKVVILRARKTKTA